MQTTLPSFTEVAPHPLLGNARHQPAHRERRPRRRDIKDSVAIKSVQIRIREKATESQLALPVTENGLSAPPKIPEDRTHLVNPHEAPSAAT